MIGRLIALAVLGFVGITALSASSGGSTASQATPYRTPADVRASLDRALVAEHDAAVEAERRRRYEAGEMGAAERMAYEAELEEARRRREAVAAAAAAARLRNLQRQRSGGGYSGGK
ncbi:hypothetical protein [Rubrivirga marina]|uniref:Uncharacterized protein n=1 Tax=Rubrivirga marina TaxID=1196024 RepID=A0A271IYI7_9BACT|nr:hypothetical protein [Rubrivirga marina]PAP76147.1 hypothetical protein BSZ37_06650 [Rubrivirga marina]